MSSCYRHRNYLKMKPEIRLIYALIFFLDYQFTTFWFLKKHLLYYHLYFDFFINQVDKNPTFHLRMIFITGLNIQSYQND